MFIVCSKETAGAIPLFDKIGGDECLYVAETPDCGGNAAKIEQYELKKVTSYDYASFQGFVAGMSYDDGVREETVAADPSAVVIENGEIIGYIVTGSFYRWSGYNSDSRDDATKYEQKIFLPLGGELRETEYYSSTTIYGSDGEENDNVSYIHMAFQKKEVNSNE